MRGQTAGAQAASSDVRVPKRFIGLVVAVLVLAFALFLAWSMTSNGRFAEDKALTEARMLNTSISSAWNYIDESQAAINYNSDGSYDFKHIYCSVAGKNIANRITTRSDGYIVRYARENPRSGPDEPDEFERRALESFAGDGGSEYYEVTDYEGKPVLRYASLLTISPNCLECHGSPAGEKDVTGALKEGMDVGDVAGVTSIVIPLREYRDQATSSALLSLLFFALLTAGVVLVMRLGLKHWAERPLTEANQRLVEANRNLEEANRVQSDFLATMSHELRTPLTAIIANADIWEREAADASSAQRETVAEVKRNSTALLAMVNNTIDAAKMDADVFDVVVEETDVVDVVDSAVGMVAALAAKRGVVITRSISPAVPLMDTDALALRKILVNLLSNAIAYSEAGQSVGLLVDVRSGWVDIVVIDGGCGIPAEEQESVFDRFGQASGAKGGSGLGLYVARQLARKLGGDVTLESEKGRGCRFTVSLPAAEQEWMPVGDGEGGSCDGDSNC